jgi:hypothetical protein
MRIGNFCSNLVNVSNLPFNTRLPARETLPWEAVRSGEKGDALTKWMRSPASIGADFDPADRIANKNGSSNRFDNLDKFTRDGHEQIKRDTGDTDFSHEFPGDDRVTHLDQPTTDAEGLGSGLNFRNNYRNLHSSSFLRTKRFDSVFVSGEVRSFEQVDTVRDRWENRIETLVNGFRLPGKIDD